MNRYKKEEKRRYDEAIKGLSEDEIKRFDLENKVKQQIEKLARDIHIDKFPEEYDFMYDSVVDAGERKKGINPMSQEYIDKIKKKRDDLGVKQLSGNGMPVSHDTYNLCLEEAKLQIGSDLNIKHPPEK
jgi:hypothetical protein